MWYPVEGENETCNAPDVFVAFGRPKGDRGSYKQWEENDVPMTVVFEVLSPSNDWEEMDDKHTFYEDHGAEEYYVYNPYKNRLHVYLRQGEALRRVRPVQNFVSPRLGIRFDLSGPEMAVFYPDGRRFLTFEEVEAQREAAEQRATTAEQRATTAEQRATTAEADVNQAMQRMTRLAELSHKARQQQASREELEELGQLERAILRP